MTKVYHVKFENKKFQGEQSVVYSLKANSISNAEKRGLKLLKKYCKEAKIGFSNWKTVKVEWFDSLDN